MGFIVLIAILFLLFLAVRRELGRFGVEQGDPRSLRAGTTKYRLHTQTGRVAGAIKEREQHIVGHVAGGTYGSIYNGSGTISGGVSGSVRSYTTVHDQLFLTGADGSELPLQLANWNLAVHDGQILSAIWAIREGKNWGPFLQLRNHTTNQHWSMTQLVKKYLMVRGRLMNLLIFLGMTALVAGIAEVGTTDSEGSIWGTSIIMGLILSAPLIVIVSLVTRTMTNRRVQRFFDRGMAPLVEQLNAAARGVASAPAVPAQAPVAAQ